MLTTKQQAALAAMITHPTRAAAARACGLCERTLWRYEHEYPEFAAALQQARGEALQNASENLAACYPRAVEVLRELIDNPDTPAAARVSAACALLEFGLRYTEAAEFDARLRQLEEVVDT